MSNPRTSASLKVFAHFAPKVFKAQSRGNYTEALELIAQYEAQLKAQQLALF